MKHFARLSIYINMKLFAHYLSLSLSLCLWQLQLCLSAAFKALWERGCTHSVVRGMFADVHRNSNQTITAAAKQTLTHNAFAFANFRDSNLKHISVQNMYRNTLLIYLHLKKKKKIITHSSQFKLVLFESLQIGLKAFRQIPFTNPSDLEKCSV